MNTQVSRPAPSPDAIPWRTRPALVTLVAFVLLAVVHTWPLATAPHTLTRHDNADAFLNEWTLAWVAHAVIHDPLRIFEANIFHPARHALAFSEHLIPQGLMGAPVAWLGGSPILVFNIVLLAGFALTGWTTTLVVAAWTGDWLAGALAGSVAAFNTHTLSRMVHIQAVHVEFLPLALFALDRALRTPRVASAVSLAGWTALQMLCSGYLLVFTAVTLTVGALSRGREWLRAPFGRAGLLLLAAAIAIGICTPFLLPYAAVRSEQHLTRSLDEVSRYSAHWVDYVTTVGTLHYNWWSARFYRGTDALFPGILPLGLAIVTLATGTAWRDRRARMVAAAALACFVLSFGPATPIYRALYGAVPLLEGLRGAARFGYIAIFGTGVLAAFGLACLRRRASRRAGVAAVAATIAVGLANLEALVAPHDFVPFGQIPAVYDVLATDPPAVVVEVPFWPPGEVARNGPYVLNSTRSWYFLLNGYSGFVPPAYGPLAEVMRSFPDDASRDALLALGATHVVVHLDYVPDMADQLVSISWLEQVASGRDIRIFRIRPVF